MLDQTTFLIPTVVSASAAIMAGVLTYRATRYDTRRQAHADVMAGYAQLCDDLRAMINLNNQEIARLRMELQEMQQQLNAEREARKRERQALLQRIDELEKINQRLERRLAELQARTCKER